MLARIRKDSTGLSAIARIAQDSTGLSAIARIRKDSTGLSDIVLPGYRQDKARIPPG